MRLQVVTEKRIVDSQVFVEDFTIRSTEEAVELHFKSPVFDAWLDQFGLQFDFVGPSAPRAAFCFDDKRIRRVNQQDTSLPFHIFSFKEQQLDVEAGEPNLSFMLLEGIKDGIVVKCRYPHTIMQLNSYYYSCLDALQDLYTSHVQPFTLSSILRELDE